MIGQTLVAPTYEKLEGSLIFLAGPIQGARLWQDDAIRIINNKAPEINIANPRRSETYDGEFTEEMYNQQVDWETFHLRKSGKKGVVLFFLSKEHKRIAERAYAQTSRFELGEHVVYHQWKGINLVVGIEEGFTNRRYILRRISQDCPKVPVCDTLEQTCEEAIRLARV